MPAVMPTMSQQSSGSSAKNPDDLFAIFDSAPSTEQTGAPQDTADKKGHSHRKTSSLVGFDPLLDSMDQSKPSESTVWSHQDDDDGSTPHPLLSSPSKSTKTKPPPSHRTSKSVCVSELQDIAAQLSLDKPRALTSDEERRITLGDTTKDSITRHDRKLLKKKSQHRKSHSVSDIVGLRPLKLSPPATPVTHGKALVKQVTPTNTPPRSNTPIQSPKILRTSLSSKLSPPRVNNHKSKKDTSSPTTIQIPTLAKQSPTSFLKNASTMAPRSSEQDPSPHQMEIPSCDTLLMNAKLCALLEKYRNLDQNFDFNTLKGVDSLSLKGFVSTLDTPIAGLTSEQKPVVQAMLDCAGQDDICVEGFFTSCNDDESGLEVGIFSIQNTFIVVYRGTTEQQVKPARTKCATAVQLDEENAVHVYPPFRDAYFELEKKVYGLLDKCVEANPFCNVVFVGNAFGGALATIGAVRFASARPSLRFACHTFGSPKVGTSDFRQLVNTLPNLKVMRVEYANDANCLLPVDVGSTKWQHVGHTIAIHASVGTNNKISSNPILAYRFDNKKPTSMNRLQTRKPDISGYVRALEAFLGESSNKKLTWVELYVGQDVGKGVRGKDNEKRLMV